MNVNQIVHQTEGAKHSKINHPGISQKHAIDLTMKIYNTYMCINIFQSPW